MKARNHIYNTNSSKPYSAQNAEWQKENEHGFHFEKSPHKSGLQIKLIKLTIKVSKIASLATIVIGLLVMSGWFFDLSILKSLSPNFVSMKFNTALCFVLSGISLFLANFSKKLIFSRISASFVIAIGVVTTLQYAFNFNVGIDQLLVSEIAGSTETFSPGRMALNTSVGFILLGSSLLTIDLNLKFDSIISQIIALIIIFMSSLSILGYIFGISDLYRYAGFTSMALHTASAFTIVSIGILLTRSQSGVLAIISTNSLGGYMARRLLPALMLIPFILVWLQIEWIHQGFLKSILMLQLMSAGIISLYIFFVWRIAKTINSLELKFMEIVKDMGIVNERFTLAVKAANFGVWDWDIQTGQPIWDQKMFELYGYKKKEEGADVSKIWQESFHPDDLDEQSQLSQKALADGVDYQTEYRIIRKDGCVRHLKTIGEILRDDDGKPYRMIGITYDMTEQKQIEEKLKDSEKKYRYLFHENPIPIWIFDEKSLNFLEVNKAAIEHYGYKLEEFTKLSFLDVRPHEDIKPTLEMLHSEKIEKHRGVWRHQKKNGEIIYVDVKGHKLTYEGKAARLVISHDVTAQKEAELKVRQLNEELEKRVKTRTQQLSDSNTELESFAYTVSHDLRAPLRHVIGFTEKLERVLRGKEDEEVNRLTGKIKNSTSKLGRLIDELLTFSRLGRTDIVKKPVALINLVNEVIADLSHPTDSIYWDIGNLPVVLADKTQLKMVLQNLLENAIKFSSKKEKAIIEIKSTENEREHIISITDHGDGFNMDYIERLFGVFQRLHSNTEFEGTGIGLATVKRVIKKHNGNVWAEGKEGEGATFYFSLPKKFKITKNENNEANSNKSHSLN